MSNVMLSVIESASIIVGFAWMAYPQYCAYGLAMKAHRLE